jgi:transcriptional regulator with XRE-family HTH domain
MANEFGLLLRSLRQKKKLSLRKVAKMTDNMSSTYLSDIERGNRKPPRYYTVLKIVQVMDLTEDEARKLFDAASVARAGNEDKSCAEQKRNRKEAEEYTDLR